MPDSYNTIEKKHEGLYKEKGSKFLAFAHPIKDEDEAMAFVENYKKTRKIL